MNESVVSYEVLTTPALVYINIILSYSLQISCNINKRTAFHTKIECKLIITVILPLHFLTRTKPGFFMVLLSSLTLKMLVTTIDALGHF